MLRRFPYPLACRILSEDEDSVQPEELRRIECPVLVVVGEDDPIYSAETMPGPAWGV
jgi:pimeloyl-ACP methyl ester carboxylesterase